MMSWSLLILPKGHNMEEGTGDFFSYMDLKGSGKTVAYWHEETALNTKMYHSKV